MADILFGSLCLSDIPKELIRTVKLKDGSVKKYLSISVLERKSPSKYGDTHFVSCAPKKEEQKEGVNYIFGDLKRWVDKRASTPVSPAQPLQDDEDLPF